VEYARWAPHYERIAREFGFPPEQEAEAATVLRGLLPADARLDPLGRCRVRIAGKEAIVVGLAPEAGAPPLDRLPVAGAGRVVLAADGAAARCLNAGIVPDLVVTDLAGPVASEVTANARGSLVVVHAHGDNVPALRAWVPEFSGELAGSWSGAPDPELLDVGGFTDGERAAYLAEHCGASSVLLWGFDFSRVAETDPAERSRKLAKLRFASEDLTWLASSSPVPLIEWRRDGSRRPYQDGAAERSTQ
jgi:2-amino-4-hydroxy-6-hydroxymethyldihydropteridine diphosphokinase